MSDRQRRVEQHEVGVHCARVLAQRRRNVRRREQGRGANPANTKGKRHVKGFRVRLCSCEDCVPLRREPPPQLEEVGLDPANFRREIVRDKEGRHTSGRTLRSADALFVPESRNETSAFEHPYCASFRRVDDDRVARVAAKQETDDAVVTSGRGLVDAAPAIDPDIVVGHGTSFTARCHQRDSSCTP